MCHQCAIIHGGARATTHTPPTCHRSSADTHVPPHTYDHRVSSTLACNMYRHPCATTHVPRTPTRATKNATKKVQPKTCHQHCATKKVSTNAPQNMKTKLFVVDTFLVAFFFGDTFVVALFLVAHFWWYFFGYTFLWHHFFGGLCSGDGGGTTNNVSPARANTYTIRL